MCHNATKERGEEERDQDGKDKKKEERNQKRMQRKKKRDLEDEAREKEEGEWGRQTPRMQCCVVIVQVKPPDAIRKM